MYANKTILITGANSGLGRNLALNYAKQGGRIVNLSRNIKKMESLQKELENINHKYHFYYPVDFSNFKQIESIKKDMIIKKVMPDVVINNARNFLCSFRN